MDAALQQLRRERGELAHAPPDDPDTPSGTSIRSTADSCERGVRHQIRFEAFRRRRSLRCTARTDVAGRERRDPYVSYRTHTVRNPSHNRMVLLNLSHNHFLCVTRISFANGSSVYPAHRLRARSDHFVPRRVRPKVENSDT